uniref:uncharacterized protein LOC122597447 n=1 Tax=Erigeron canadensis TaxID=72917 RepID=UPI001CB93DC8|nr:uncharacterized protein LOC122597447 [Erigeron canadensis]
MAPTGTQEQTAPLSTDSSNHPLYLHQNDHPGIILITKKLVGSENYNSWKRSMTIALSAKNKLKLVNGEYEEPSPDSDLRALWERANDMVISWILNTVSDEISNNLNFVSNACALWKELNEHYSQLDGHRIFQVTHELVDLTQHNTSIETYYHKMKGLWDELDALEAPYLCTCKCTCENGKEHGKREQRKKLVQFLMGLDESYTNIRGQILLMQPLPTVSKAYGMLRQEEKQREGPKSTLVTPIALNTFTSLPKPYATTQLSKTYIPRTNLQIERRSVYKKGITCAYCHREGHTRDECYKLVGYPSGHPLHNKYQPPPTRTPNTYNNSNKGKTINMVIAPEDILSTSKETPYTLPTTPQQDAFMAAKLDQLQNQINQVMLFMQQTQQNPDSPDLQNSNIGTAGIFSFTTNSKPKFRFIACCLSKSKDTWITDSGATDHISKTLSNMHNIRTLDTSIEIFLPNGQTTLVTIIGSVTINDNITLHDVFYVPSFTYNLMSISKFLKPHTSITFTYNSCIFQDHDKQIAQGILCNGLYLLSTDDSSSKVHSQATILNAQSNVHLWHARLGHCSFPVLKQITSLPVSVTTCTPKTVCSTCPLSKHHLLPFPSSSSHAKSLFELVHADVWGHTNTPPLTNANTS